MFDISFSEFIVIAIVALVVIGPERLPGVARTFGHLFARMQRYLHEIKIDIAREVEVEELKRVRGEIKTTARSIEQTMSQEIDATRAQLKEVAAAPPAVAPSAEAAEKTRRQA